MKSMTGFGKSEEETSSGRIVVEARSENHRFLDVHLQLPDAILSIEQNLTEIVKKSLTRGKARITIVLEGLKNRLPTINIELAKESLKTLKRLKKELEIEEKMELEHLLMVKEFFSSDVKPTLSKGDYSKVRRALTRAVEKLDAARVSEGKKLEKDLRHRVKKIESLTEQIKFKRENSIKELSEKLKERIKKILEDTQIDETRLYQEAAFLADRSDITEEIVRLKAHVSKFKETVSRSGSVGRELDFLLQEMTREAGTISAKSKDAGVSHLTIELRSEIEKMREQVQNIE